MKTRGQLTAIPYQDEVIVLAKAGVQATGSRVEQNAAMLELFLTREPTTKVRRRAFVSMRDQWLGDRDVVREDSEIRLNLDFDMKRRPLMPTVVRVGEHEHIAFDTVPWRSAEEAELTRILFDEWRRKRCLKTIEDFNDWMAFRDHLQARRARLSGGSLGGIKLTREGAVGALRRMFLRAYAREEWGAVRTESYDDVARKLTDAGYPTKKDDLKNARRSQLDENSIPLTDDVLKLVSVIEALFPGVDIRRALISTPKSPFNDESERA